MLVLRRLTGPRQGESLRFDQGVIRLGRANTNDVTFDREHERMVGNFHAELRLEGSEWFLYDLHSSHGSFVQGQRQYRWRITEGDHLGLGQPVGGPILLVSLRDQVSDEENTRALPGGDRGEITRSRGPVPEPTVTRGGPPPELTRALPEQTGGVWGEHTRALPESRNTPPGEHTRALPPTPQEQTRALPPGYTPAGGPAPQPYPSNTEMGTWGNQQAASPEAEPSPPDGSLQVWNWGEPEGDNQANLTPASLPSPQSVTPPGPGLKARLTGFLHRPSTPPAPGESPARRVVDGVRDIVRQATSRPAEPDPTSTSTEGYGSQPKVTSRDAQARVEEYSGGRFVAPIDRGFSYEDLIRQANSTSRQDSFPLLMKFLLWVVILGGVGIVGGILAIGQLQKDPDKFNRILANLRQPVAVNSQLPADTLVGETDPNAMKLVRDFPKIVEVLPNPPPSNSDPVTRALKVVLRPAGEDPSFIPVVFRDDVRGAIDELREDGQYQVIYRRMRAWSPKMMALLGELGIPPVVAAIPWVESGIVPTFDDGASGKVGLWGLSPEVALRHGLTVAPGRDDRLDPTRATLAARSYLVELFARSGGRSWSLALAAWHEGPGRLKQILTSRSSWSPAELTLWHWEGKEVMPRAMHRYLCKVLAAAVIYSEPASFGLPPLSEPVEDEYGNPIGGESRP